MDLVDIARWQFGIITVYHFLFVPLTIGLTALVAGLETAWLRTHNPEWLRLTKFFGKLLLINFAIGVVTGIVQEFQFGMNWSDYSRFVGDVFGAPLAIEGLLAFFLESTFLGLWIFGWDKLPRRTARRLHVDRAHRHAALGVLHPGGQLLDAAPGRLPLQPRHRPRRAHRLRGGDVQQGAAGDLPARRARGVPHRRAVFMVAVAGWLYVSHGKHEATARCTARAIRVGAVVALVAGSRRRGLGRRPGQDDDRGPADEDGGGRGRSTRPRRPARRSRSSPSGPPTGARRSSRSRSRACSPSSAPAPSTAGSRGSTTCATQYRAGVRPGPGRDVLLSPTATCPSSRSPTGPSGS